MSLPNETEVVETPTLPEGKEDVIEFLGETPTEETEEVEEPREKVEEPEETDELKLIEEELTEPPDEQLDLNLPVPRKDILAKYPNLFKDFPYLETAYYREQKFSNIFPQIEDAQNALEKAQTLDRFESDLMQGNLEMTLRAIKDENQNAFYRAVDNYLPNLAKVDMQAYNHIIGNLIKHTIASMVQESRRTNNEALQNTAQILHQFVFGNSEWKPPANLAKQEQENPKEKEIQAREQELAARQFQGVFQDLAGRTQNTILNTINKHLDPKSSMSEYVRNKATQDAFSSLENLVQRDSRFQTLLGKLWEAAYQSGYNPQAVDRIRQAYLSKAQTLLPTVIKQARNTALKGANSNKPATRDKSPIAQGRSAAPTKTQTSVPKGMKTLDFLNQD